MNGIAPLDDLPEGCGLRRVAECLGWTYGSVRTIRGTDPEFEAKTDRFLGGNERRMAALPSDWRDELRGIPNGSLLFTDLCAVFGVAPSTMNMWRRMNRDFASKCFHKLKHQRRSLLAQR